MTMDKILKAVLAILALCGFIAFMVSDLAPPAANSAVATVAVSGAPPPAAAAAPPATAETGTSQAPAAQASNAPAPQAANGQPAAPTTFSVATIDTANFGAPMVNPDPLVTVEHGFTPPSASSNNSGRGDAGPRESGSSTGQSRVAGTPETGR